MRVNAPIGTVLATPRIGRKPPQNKFMHVPKVLISFPSPLICCAEKSAAIFVNKSELRDASQFHQVREGDYLALSLLQFRSGAVMRSLNISTQHIAHCQVARCMHTSLRRKTTMAGGGHGAELRAFETCRQLKIWICSLQTNRSMQGIQFERGISARRAASPLLDVAH